MAKRKYSMELLDALQKKQYETEKNGVKITVKPIPEGGESGDMDPRLYKSMKMLSLLVKFMPKLNPNKSVAEQIKPFKKIMNGVKSLPIANEGVQTVHFTVDSTNNHRVPVRMYKRDNHGKNLPMFVYYHGGGFFGGSPDVVEQMCKLLVQKIDCVAFNIDYRLCPESHFPQPFDDCWLATKYIYENSEKLGGDKTKLCVSGDSAGGNLAAAMCQKDKSEGHNIISAQALYYPATNISKVKTKFHHDADKTKYVVGEKHKKVLNVTISMMDMLAGNMLSDLYLQGHTTADNIYASPALGDLSKMPPTLLMFGEHDMLVFDNITYAEGLLDAGVKVTTIVYRGLGHGFADQIGILPQAEDSIAEIAKFMEKTL